MADTPDEQKKTWLDDLAPGMYNANNVDPQSSDSKVIPIGINAQKPGNSPHDVVAQSIEKGGTRGIASLTGAEMVALRGEWSAGALTVGQMCDVWRVEKRDLLKAAEKWGKRALRDEYRARLSAGLVDNEAAFGAVVADGQDFLPKDASQAVDRAVARAVEVVRQHKSDISGSRQLVQALATELAAMSVHQNELEAWCEIAAEVRAGLRDGRTGEALAGNKTSGTRFAEALATFMGMISLGSRAQTIDKLTNSLAKLVTLERQAFQIANDPGDKAGDHIPVEERLRRYVESGGIPTQPARSTA